MAKKSKLVARIKALEAEIARLIAGRKTKKAKKKAKAKKPARKAAPKKAATTKKPAKPAAAPKAKKKAARKKRVIPPPMDRIMAAGEPEFVQPLDVV